MVKVNMLNIFSMQADMLADVIARVDPMAVWDLHTKNDDHIYRVVVGLWRVLMTMDNHLLLLKAYNYAYRI